MIANPPEVKLELPIEKVASFCQRWGIVRLDIFGSVLREDFRPDSDVDFLFTPGPHFKRDKVYGAWARNYMAEELAGIVGRKVDIIDRRRVEQMENWIKRRHILQTAVPIYVD